MTLDPRATSTRTFVLWPIAAMIHGLVVRGRLDLRFAPAALAGYLCFRSAGRYRTARGGGGPGMANPPERIVTSGPYAVSRNPMYLGHLVTFASLVGATRSLLFASLFGWHLRWFDERARRDEASLAELFGEEYVRYRDEVPRWFPSTPKELVAAWHRVRNPRMDPASPSGSVV